MKNMASLMPIITESYYYDMYGRGHVSPMNSLEVCPLRSFYLINSTKQELYNSVGAFA